MSKPADALEGALEAARCNHPPQYICAHFLLSLESDRDLTNDMVPFFHRCVHFDLSQGGPNLPFFFFLSLRKAEMKKRKPKSKKY